MPLINSILKAVYKNRLREIEYFAKHPVETQILQLKSLLQKAGDTEFGRKYGYSEIKNIEEFRNKVPLQKYEELSKIIDRIRKGEQNILWPEKIIWFAKSSGTTNDKSKFIPVSRESLYKCHYQGGKDTIAIFNRNFPDNRVFSGKTLTLGGSHQIDNFGYARSGDLSAIMLQNIPFWYDFIRAPKAKIALISNWEEKLSKLAKATLKQNITAIAGVPSWNLVMLKYILEFSGKKTLPEVWPGLELFLHGGVNFAPYREQYKRLIPSENMRYVETYNASEGFFAIQDDLFDQGMLLMLDYGIFYEFIPLGTYYGKKPKAVHIGEVKTGVNYAIVISTNGGLWRYIPGDTVMFTSLYPHKILVTGRTRHFINAFGEEVIIDNAEKALMAACKATGALVHEYTAAPVYMGEKTNGRHEWLIEFERQPDNLDNFISTLDKSLMNINSDYEAKRYNNITLDLPVVRSLKKGTFYKWFSQKGKLGGQNKMPRLSNDRKYVEELLKIESSI